jgi:membrane associated rhomboid family serine protease
LFYLYFYGGKYKSMNVEVKRLLYALPFPCLLVIALWLILLLEKGLGADWHRLGVYPRSIEGLLGILTGPFIHTSAKHLFSNSIPLIVQGWCLFYFYREMGFSVMLVLWILGGALTWCIGRESWHIGASGWIYGLSFFLFFSGIFRRYIPLLAVSLLVVFLYGSTVWNMLPVAEWVDHSVSWEGHLAGAASGWISAFLFRKHGPQRPADPEDEDEENFPDPDLPESTTIFNSPS